MAGREYGALIGSLSVYTGMHCCSVPVILYRQLAGRVIIRGLLQGSSWAHLENADEVEYCRYLYPPDHNHIRHVGQTFYLSRTTDL